jgi:hypothetical protein
MEGSDFCRRTHRQSIQAETQVRGMTNRRLDTDLYDDANDCTAQIAQSRNAISSRVPTKNDIPNLSKMTSLSNVVSAGIICTRGEPRGKLGLTSAALSLRRHAIWCGVARSQPPVRQQRMTTVENTKAALSRRRSHLYDSCNDLIGIQNLTDDADLHVVDKQGHLLRVAGFFQNAGNPQSIRLFHDCPLHLSRIRICAGW